jgi:hypothetical protein
MEKIPVTGLISPIYDTDVYPVIDPRLGIDGMRSLNNTTEMFNLPLEKRRGGMVVSIPNTSSNTSVYYALKPEGNGVTWSLGATGNWYSFLTSFTGSNAIPVKYNITSESITVPVNYEYLLWGNMTIATGGSFVNDGKAYFINGTISTSGNGTYSGTGQYNYVTVPTKYSETFVCTPTGHTVSHNLGTEDVVYSVRDYVNKNFLTVNVEIINSNQLKVSSHTTFLNTKIVVIG